MADIGEGDNPRHIEVLPLTPPVLPARETPAPAPTPATEPVPSR